MENPKHVEPASAKPALSDRSGRAGNDLATECASSFDQATVLGSSSSTDLPTMAGVASDWHPADAPTSIDLANGSGQMQGSSSGMVKSTILLVPGTLLGNRYEIVQLLGEGGMGAVYKARDRELERVIALKVIRPELAGRADILQRFKQELILARQVTDPNIIRIFDLGEADGIKFITMEFVEGESLHHILRTRGKLALNEVVSTLEQTLSGLRAAHKAGVIHRDLKPGNIMRDAQGRVVIMDFGLARSLDSDGLTKTGAMLGTIEYMSPEQALGMTLDARSDLFTVGLICYELLTGKMPFHADSAVASLLRRTKERAAPITDLDRQVPVVLSNIISKCLERDPNLRYQSAQAALDDLYAWQRKGPNTRVSASSTGLLLNRLREVSWKPAAMAAISLVLAVALALVWSRGKTRTASVVQHVPVSVLVADFHNRTSDPVFDDTLEPMFNVALEGANFINAFNRNKARQLAGDLPNPSSKLDEKTARLVAVGQGISAIVTGSLNGSNGSYNLSVEAIDAVTGKPLAKSDVSASTKDEVLLQIPKVAAPIRKALGDTTPESVQLQAAGGAFTTSSVEAVHEYSIAMQQQFAGKFEDAQKSFAKAAELDPNFARAYAGMAGTAGNMGQLQKADQYTKLAMEHLDRMTERERYRVRGYYYIRTENWQKCVDEYGELTKQFPADNIGLTNLALCYGRMLDMPKAVEVAQRGLQLAPKDVMARMNFALYACYASDFQSCEREARSALDLNPTYEEAFLVLAYAQLGQNDLRQASETYGKLQKVSSWGASLASSGMANLALYQGHLQEAVQVLQTGAAADMQAKNPDAAADKYVMLANANTLRGDKPAVLAAVQSALANSQSVKARFLAARALIEIGETTRARKLADSLASELQVAPQNYAKLVLGEAALKEHNVRQAVQSFSEARAVMDSWFARFDLGRAYLEQGAFTEADSEFDRCIKRRGEVLELFMDDMPTYSYLPVVYYYQGRVREGLKGPGSNDSYRAYLNIRGLSTEDPLVADIHRRLGR